MLRDVVAKTRRDGSTAKLAERLSNLSWIEQLAGDTEHARRSVEESIVLSRQDAHYATLAAALKTLAHIEVETDGAAAITHYGESLRLAREHGYPRVIASCLEGGAAIQAAGGDRVRAAGLLGAAAAIRRRSGDVLTPDERAEVDVIELQCRAALTGEAFTRAWDGGAALHAGAAADWALEIWGAG